MNYIGAIVAVTSLDCPGVTLRTRHFQLFTNGRAALVAILSLLYAQILTFFLIGETAWVHSCHEHGSYIASSQSSWQRNKTVWERLIPILCPVRKGIVFAPKITTVARAKKLSVRECVAHGPNGVCMHHSQDTPTLNGFLGVREATDA